MKRLLLTLAIALFGMAQEKPAEPPKITAEMREDFFQAKADILDAQAKLADAQKRFQSALAAMQAVCPLVLDDKGKPQCAPPETASKPDGVK